MNDKYRNTAAQLFKLRMQFKAQVNHLRKTYHQVVVQKPVPEKKHYLNRLVVQTALVPERERSLQKQNSQKRHYSPFSYVPVPQKTSFSGKKHYDNKSVDNLGKLLKQKCQQRKKSLSYVFSVNKSMTNLREGVSLDGLKVGMNDKSLSQLPRPSKRIIQKYHKFDNFLG